MNAKFLKICFITIVLIALLLLSSCEKSIENYADELTLYSWKASFDNGNSAKLCFENDTACFTLKTGSGQNAKISGFCEISNDIFVIHDDYTGCAYAFKYKVNFDSVDIIYDETTLSLCKIYT